MGQIAFAASRRPSGAFQVQNFDLKSDAAFNIGAPVKRNSTANQILEFGGGADVTGLLGFAIGGATAGLPKAKGTYAFGTTVGVYMANEDTEYVGQIVSGDSDTVLVPAATDLRTYGIIKSTTTGNWYIDQGDTTNVVLTVTQLLPEINAVLFKLISTAIGV